MDQYQDYMGMAGLPNAYYPMMQYPAAQMESMYPRCYYIIYPRVKRMCDMMYQQGMMAPTPEMLQQMTDQIYDEVEPMMVEEDMMEMDMQMMPENMQDMQMMPEQMYPMGTKPMMEDKDCCDMDTRQFGFASGFFPRPRRRFLRDLISILLIRQLLRRRRRPFFGFGF